MRGPLVFSAILHVAGIATLIGVQRDRPDAMPPLYKVNIVAAPPGPRAIGTVNPAATPTPATPTPPPPRPETPERSMPAPPTPTPPRRTPPPPATPVQPNAATPTPSKTAPATPAGGGPTGGRGADVATVRTEGIDFPFPGYLNNIVRQVAVRFKPENPRAALRAEVMFVIRRDGSVADVRFITSSRNYGFDLEAQGAIDAAARSGAFGPLPAGFSDDALTVIFSFDPRLLQ
jgi:protein TonB